MFPHGKFQPSKLITHITSQTENTKTHIHVFVKKCYYIYLFTDSEDDKIKVKSLEEIQRAKALLSMGLIELKSGKIVKIGKTCSVPHR